MCRKKSFDEEMVKLLIYANETELCHAHQPNTLQITHQRIAPNVNCLKNWELNRCAHGAMNHHSRWKKVGANNCRDRKKTDADHAVGAYEIHMPIFIYTWFNDEFFCLLIRHETVSTDADTQTKWKKILISSLLSSDFRHDLAQYKSCMHFRVLSQFYMPLWHTQDIGLLSNRYKFVSDYIRAKLANWLDTCNLAYVYYVYRHFDWNDYE